VKISAKTVKKKSMISEEVVIFLEVTKNISNGNLVSTVSQKYKYIYIWWRIFLTLSHTIYFMILKHFNRLNEWLNSKLEEKKKSFHKNKLQDFCCNYFS
jgi:hypothetical protein